MNPPSPPGPPSSPSKSTPSLPVETPKPTPKPEQTEHSLTKEQLDFLKIFESKLCVVSPSCRAADVGRTTFYEWCNNNPKFKAAVEDCKTSVKDFGESALFSLINKGNPAATIFFNKCQNKDRGYVERQEIEHTGNASQPIEINIRKTRDIPSELLDDEKEEDRKIIVVDIETTNFLQRGGLIVDVGIIELDLNTGGAKVLYDNRVKEEGFNESHKNAWVFNNSSLTYEAVDEAGPLEKDKLQEIFRKYPATAYNKKFDFDFLRSRGLEINELPCLMLTATGVCKIPKTQFPAHNKGAGFKWPKLQEAWDILIGEEYKEAHRALDDAAHAARVAYELYDKGALKITWDKNSKQQ